MVTGITHLLLILSTLSTGSLHNYLPGFEIQKQSCNTCYTNPFMDMPVSGWILLLYELPKKLGTLRVSLWRKLKKTGAIQLKTSAYLLPNDPENYERFQWLGQQVRDAKGQATLIRLTEIEDLSEADVVSLFNKARAEEYDELAGPLNTLLKQNRRKRTETFNDELKKVVATFQQIRSIDFFNSSRGNELEALIQEALALQDIDPTSPKLNAKSYVGKVWLTRPRPGIDRVGSAWLIRKFIDAKARFAFDSDPHKHPGALAFDMPNVEFTHHGEDCTFETLVKRFGIRDKAVKRIAEMVHDADLEDDKFHRVECVGLNAIFKGWAALGLPDQDIFTKGAETFDALYALLASQK